MVGQKVNEVREVALIIYLTSEPNTDRQISKQFHGRSLWLAPYIIYALSGEAASHLARMAP